MRGHRVRWVRVARRSRHPIGRYDTLDDARASLRSTTDPVDAARRLRAERATVVLATAAGSAALAFALTAGALAPYL